MFKREFVNLQNTQKKLLLGLLDACNFFNATELILKRLTTVKVFNFSELRGNQSRYTHSMF